jgi:hypothetical protein
MDKRVQSLPQPRLHSVAATAKPKVATKSGLLHGGWEDGVQVFRGGFANDVDAVNQHATVM